MSPEPSGRRPSASTTAVKWWASTLDAGGRTHRCLWDNGRFITIDGPEGTGASATDINDRGQIIGLYADSTDPGTIGGFLLSKRVYATFDAPDAALTIPFGINNRGQIVGATTTDPETGAHGFLLAKGVEGPFTPIDFPDAPVTGATDINDRGQIVGFYVNPDATPDRQPSLMQMPMMMSGG
jgi:uncharacterized membrane protein